VILFDEIEKAHADVFNVLLQVLDDGRLTDGQGRTVDFKNAIVIMTSNLASPIIQQFSIEGRTSPAEHRQLEGLVRQELRGHFRPEFLNRLDDIIIFHSLGEAELGRIVELQLARLEKRLEQQHLAVSLDDSARKLLAREGHDPQFGARPLKRAIQDLLLDPLALKLLDGEFKAGDRITVLAENGELAFRKE
jgi:ATP-dependent Clp protease ATP-binding subunit ClpB